MLTLLYAGPTIFEIEYNLIKTHKRNQDGSPTWRLQHDTLLFQTFVLMNIANMFNCRVLPSKKRRELNIVTHIFCNYWFMIIVLAELNIQVAMTGYPHFCVIFGTTPITFAMQMTALGCALGSLVVGFFTKLTPYKWTNFYDKQNFGAPPTLINDLTA